MLQLLLQNTLFKEDVRLSKIQFMKNTLVIYFIERQHGKYRYDNYVYLLDKVDKKYHICNWLKKNLRVSFKMVMDSI